MSATTHGDINFSLSDETGLYTETISQDMTVKEKEIASGGGETIAAAFYGHKGTFSMEGALKTSGGSPTWTLAAAITIANSVYLENDVTGYTSGAKFIITSQGVSLGAEAEERRTISGNIYPFLAAAN
jgi:hypothetical protein